MRSRRLLAGFCLLLAVTAAEAQRRSTASMVIPAGTQVAVRMNEGLSSADAQPEQEFTGTLAAAVVVNGRTLYAKGSEVRGNVVDAKPSGRLSNSGELVLELTQIRSGSRWYPLTAEPFIIKGESHKKSNVTKIGGGAAAGAIIGAIAGGGKGAAIGAAVGAGAGTATAAATGKKEAVVEPEAILTWTVAAAAEPAAAAPDDRMRHHDDDRRYDPVDDPDRYIFSARDRRVLNACLAPGTSGLPPGLAKKDRLPPGLEKQLVRNGKLPPGLQKRVSPLPLACERDLPRLPRDWERVVYGRRVMVIDPVQTIIDILVLAD